MNAKDWSGPVSHRAGGMLPTRTLLEKDTRPASGSALPPEIWDETGNAPGRSEFGVEGPETENWEEI